MPDKGGDYGTKAVTTLAGVAAAFVTRKALTFIWTKVRGEAPPDKAEDPDVSLGEALAWTIVAGMGVAVARLLAVRFAVRQSSKRLTGTPGSS
ncbi:MAG TPA: DUF4235 domain-containing protein [Streptosporangiaceae bacterium]